MLIVFPSATSSVLFHLKNGFHQKKVGGGVSKNFSASTGFFDWQLDEQLFEAGQLLSFSQELWVSGLYKELVVS